VQDRLGVHISSRGPGPDASDLIGLALRHNPRRAHLLVSRVLGKHIPTDPRLVRTTGLLLGSLVRQALGPAPSPAPALPPATAALLQSALRGDHTALATLHAVTTSAVQNRKASTPPAGIQADPTAPGPLVVGFAETATALGHCVADALDAPTYLHTTRRRDPDETGAVEFREEHSHAVQHALLPADPQLLAGRGPLVLVDDELSTGQTAINTITTLHRIAPRDRYIVAALLDTRATSSPLTEAVTALGAQVDTVAISTATLDLPDDLADQSQRLRAQLARDHPRTADAQPGPAPIAQRLHLSELGWPPGLPVGARHGWSRQHRDRAEQLLAPIVERLVRHLPKRRVLVLGTEELMALPLRIAEQLQLTTGTDVAFSTTTRSPALVVPDSGYAITSALQFPAHDTPSDGPGPRFAYNLGGAVDPAWEAILLVVDAAADTPALADPGGLLAALTTRTQHLLVLVTP
jgi:hypothetical protein